MIHFDSLNYDRLFIVNSNTCNKNNILRSDWWWNVHVRIQLGTRSFLKNISPPEKGFKQRGVKVSYVFNWAFK